MNKPDSIDWKIITLLNENGRLSSAEIARRIGDISSRSVKVRIDNLIKDEIIKIRSIVNPDSVGYTLLADVFIEVDPGELINVVDQLKKLPNVSYIACATGETDIIISLRTKDLSELFRFVTEVIGKLPGVRDTKTYPLPLNIKSITTWLPPNINNE